ncbi:hypothetical protein SIN8267_01489 [Sinobacterium norvegicum]|uniref:VPLPA-CTERM sorting domain-containing protein n=1 Tax=Sinobacterium norvegicum TaxID=1641715 RepID=A0ABM9ADV0_9GAMM|nr:VPLPA-CTERM sorting domain-containing protein [Sinobacterium norvegicum]CAH0991386.1 hypothetical protein SIN8267_01489 [Sinobacterium norvegicum]
MKKLLIAASVAAAVASTGVNAAQVVLHYDVSLAGTISGGSSGSQSGGGTATIVVDDETNYGAFVMNTALATSSTSFGSTLTANTENVVWGQFDPLAFLDGQGLVFDADGATSRVTACTDTSPPVFGNTVCSNAPVGSELPFTIKTDGAGNQIMDASNIGLVTLTSTLTINAPFVGNVMTDVDYTLTMNPAGSFAALPDDVNLGLYNDLANPVPVPGAAWLFGSALVGLGGIARRRRKAA